jgi:hypothetical protein
MKKFLISLLLGVGVATLAAVALARVLVPELAIEQQPRLTERPATSAGQTGRRVFAEGSEVDLGPFTEREAIDVVSGRLGNTARAEQLRQRLRTSAQVSYHSPSHWTVRLDAASWTAHGPGRYAEPDNDAARQLEQEAARP